MSAKKISLGVAGLTLVAALAGAQEPEYGEEVVVEAGDEAVIEAGDEAVVEAEDEVGQIVVTATCTEHELADAPGAVTVIGRREIEKQGGADIGDVMAGSPAVDVVRYGGPGSSSTVHLRGTAGVHTLVLVDGRTVNSPSLGSADVSDIAPAFIERVEIVRGPASALYGADAVGGVVQVITREAPDERVSEADVSFGSFGAASATFLIGAPFAAGKGLFGLSAYQTDGHRPNSYFEKQELFGKLELGDETMGRTVLTLGLGDWRTGWPGVRPARDPALRTDSQAAFGTNEVSSLLNFGESSRGFLQADYRRGGLRLRFSADRVEDSTHREWIDFFSPDHLAQDQLMKTTSPELEACASWELSSGMQMTAGAELAYDHFQVETWDLNVDAGSRAWNERTDERTTGSVWSEVELEGDLYQGLIGVRLDTPSDFDMKATARALGVWKAAPSARLELGLGTAYRAPSLDDLNYPWDGFAEGNPLLKPEDSLETDVRFKWQPEGLPGTRASASVFLKDVEDMIRWQPEWDPVAMTETWRPDNLSDVRILGAELEARASLGRGFAARFAYTYLDAEETGPRLTYADYSDLTAPFTFTKTTRRLSYAPEHAHSFGLDWTAAVGGGSFTAGLSVSRISEVVQYYQDWNEIVLWTEYEVSHVVKKLEDHVLVGLRLALSWEAGEVYARVDNLLDEEYSRQFGSDLDDLNYPMPGRTVTVGARMKF